MSRSRLFLTDKTEAGSAESINATLQLPFNATLLQVTMAISAVPTTSESLIIVKDSVLGPAWDIVLMSIDPAEEGKQDIICNGRWEYRKGDSIVATYTNTDDNDIGFEAVLTEGD